MATDTIATNAPKTSSFKRIGTMREAGLIAIILALSVIMSFASPHFLTFGNFRAMLMSFSVEGIVVVGMTILLIVGGIDLAVGSVVCFAMVLSGSLFLAGLDPWTASLIGILASSAIGGIMGFFVTVVGLSHFITSLAAMVIVRGICLIITKGTPLSLFTLPPSFKAVGQGTFYGVPYVILIFVAVVVIFDFLLRRATAFRKVFYTGSNEKAALYSGIKTSHVKFWVTVLCSTLAGTAGVIYMSRFGAATPTFGVGMELNIIAAAVIGGDDPRRHSRNCASLGGHKFADPAERLGLLAGHDQGVHSAHRRFHRPSSAQTEGRLTCRSPN